MLLHNHTGGIVRAEHSTFKNNRRSAEFMWYRNINPVNKMEIANKSYFRDCTFVTDTLHSDVHPFVGHVTMWGVNGIKFQGCRFENNIPVSTATKERVLGSGIRSNDAGYTVEDYFTTHCSFKNLQQGVYMEKSSAPYKVKVKDAVFDKCVRGVRNEGVDLCEITGNTFNVGNLAQRTEVDSQGTYLYEGVLLRGCTGFKVERNSFANASYPGASLTYPTAGIRADGTGEKYNQIYKNTFTGMYIGNLANRVNQKDTFPASGLRYICNENSGITAFDFCVTNFPFMTQAGINPNQGSNSFPVNNEFTNCSNACNPKHFYNDADAVQVNYYYFGDDHNSNPLYPAYRMISTVFPHEVTSTNNPNSCSDVTPVCSTCITIHDFSDEYIVQRSAYNDYRQQYIGLIDDGSTSFVLDEIATASNGTALKTYLDGIAPNLSREALEAGIERMSLLTETGVYQVLRDNAEAVDDSIIAHFVYKYYELNPEGAMPEWMVDTIRMRMDSLTLRSYLHDTILYHAAAKEQMAFSVLGLIAEDTTGLDLNLYREWLDSIGGLWAKQELVNTYLHEGRLDTIIPLIDSVALRIDNSEDSSAFANYRNYLSGYVEWLETDSSVMKLSPTYIAALNERATDNEHLKGSTYARNILNFFCDSTYFTPPHLPDDAPQWMGKRDLNETEQHKAQEAQRQEPNLKPVLKIYPNPAKDYVTIEYSDLEFNWYIEILDVFGRTIILQAGDSKTSKIEVNTQGFPSGIYFVKILARGDLADKGKFNILK